ncbi:hypothetical protein HWI79_3430, partial [Cryptosporidium felis]
MDDVVPLSLLQASYNEKGEDGVDQGQGEDLLSETLIGMGELDISENAQAVTGTLELVDISRTELNSIYLSFKGLHSDFLKLFNDLLGIVYTNKCIEILEDLLKLCKDKKQKYNPFCRNIKYIYHKVLKAKYNQMSGLTRFQSFVSYLTVVEITLEDMMSKCQDSLLIDLGTRTTLTNINTEIFAATQSITRFYSYLSSIAQYCDFKFLSESKGKIAGFKRRVTFGGTKVKLFSKEDPAAEAGNTGRSRSVRSGGKEAIEERYGGEKEGESGEKGGESGGKGDGGEKGGD